jgi:hypothetical protein
MKRSLSLIIFLILFLSSFTAVNAGDEWKPVTPEELALKAPKVEKDADAEAIFWDVKVDDSSDSELALKHYIRIKIFTERGREKYSKIDLLYIKGSKVKDVAARVIKSDGTIIELRKEEIIERMIAKADGLKVKAKSFAVPNLEPGSILEYRWREVYDDAQANMRLEFQRDIPVQSATYYVKPFSGSSSMYQMTFQTDAKFEKDKKGYHKATMTDIPSFREEPYMPPEYQVKPWIMIYYSSSLNSVPDAYWALQAGNVWEAFKDYIKPNDDVKKAAAEITAGANTQDEKITKIFNFCQTQIKNITFDYSMTDEQKDKLKKNKKPSDTLKQKMGDAADIDLLFASLAMASGMESWIAFSSDRSDFFFNPAYTRMRFLHPGFIAIRTNNGWQYYNPGSPYVQRGMLMWAEEDAYAMLVGPTKFSWQKTPLSTPEKSLEKRTGKFRLLEDGTLEGEVRIEYTGHLGYAKKSAHDEDSPNQREEDLKDEIKKRLSTAELSDIRIENVQAMGDKPFIYAFKVRVPDYAAKTGKRLILTPNFFEYGEKPVFSTSERKHDIFFKYPWSEEDDITIEFPTGFELDNADSPMPLINDQGIFRNEVKMFINKEKNVLTYKRKFFFGGNGTVLFNNHSYNAIKNIFDAFNKIDTHSVTLKTTTTATTTGKPND